MIADSILFHPDGRIWTRPAPDPGAAPDILFRYASLEPPSCAPGVNAVADAPCADAAALPLRDVLERLGPDAARAAVRAREILVWRLDNRHCGRCGAVLLRHADPDERAMVCPACGASFWPRLSPAAIVLVERAGEDGPEVLLERSATDPAPFWRLVSGFVEPGETAEEAAAREVREETGVEIGAPRPVGSQSWPFPAALMLAFRATAAADSPPPRPDGREVAECRWFPRSALPALPPGASVARRLVEAWAAGREGL